MGVTEARTRQGDNQAGPGDSSTRSAAVEEDGDVTASVWFAAGRRPSAHQSLSSAVGVRHGKRGLPGLRYDAAVSFTSLGPDSGPLVFGPLSRMVEHYFVSGRLRYWHNEVSLDTVHPCHKEEVKAQHMVEPSPCCAVTGSVCHGAWRAVPAAAGRRQRLHQSSRLRHFQAHLRERHLQKSA